MAEYRLKRVRNSEQHFKIQRKENGWWFWRTVRYGVFDENDLIKEEFRNACLEIEKWIQDKRERRKNKIIPVGHIEIVKASE